MSALKKVLTVVHHLVVVLSFVAGFALGAICGETVFNKHQEPTTLTYFLAK